MAGSLQDQLLGAGLADSKKAKQLDREKRRERRVARRSRDAAVDETRAAAQQARADKAARDRELNRQRGADAGRRAVAAQIVQLVEGHRLDRRGARVGFHFACDGKVKKLFVSDVQQRQLAVGAVAIARIDERFELVPAPVARKIAERDPARVIFCNEVSADAMSAEEQEWYSDYEIPDDLMW